MNKKLAVYMCAWMAVLVLAFVWKPVDCVKAETEYTVIEEEEIPLSNVEDGNRGALILAGLSCVITIGAAFIWLRSEKKRVVEEEE